MRSSIYGHKYSAWRKGQYLICEAVLKTGAAENGPVTTCRPLTHELGWGAAGGGGRRRASSLCSSRRLLVPGSYTDDILYFPFQGNSSPFGTAPALEHLLGSL